MMDRMLSEQKEEKDCTSVDSAPRYGRNAAGTIVHLERSVESSAVDISVGDEEDVKPSSLHNP